MQYINLNTLKLEKTTPEDKIMHFLQVVDFDDSKAISDQWLITRAAVKNAFQDIDRPTRPHCFHFLVEPTEPLTEESFESAVKVILAAFFEELVGQSGLGRPRERRLDVPEALKEVNCNMSLLKRAVNYKTVVDKFQVQIDGTDEDGFRYILVGDFDA